MPARSAVRFAAMPLLLLVGAEVAIVRASVVIYIPATKEVQVKDFPAPGRTATLIWQESQQNFATKSVTP